MNTLYLSDSDAASVLGKVVGESWVFSLYRIRKTMDRLLKLSILWYLEFFICSSL